MANEMTLTTLRVSLEWRKTTVFVHTWEDLVELDGDRISVRFNGGLDEKLLALKAKAVRQDGRHRRYADIRVVDRLTV